jgi:hypothetical protein
MQPSIQTGIVGYNFRATCAAWIYNQSSSFHAAGYGVGNGALTERRNRLFCLYALQYKPNISNSISSNRRCGCTPESLSGGSEQP